MRIQQTYQLLLHICVRSYILQCIFMCFEYNLSAYLRFMIRAVTTNTVACLKYMYVENTPHTHAYMYDSCGDDKHCRMFEIYLCREHTTYTCVHVHPYYSLNLYTSIFTNIGTYLYLYAQIYLLFMHTYIYKYLIYVIFINTLGISMDRWFSRRGIGKAPRGSWWHLQALQVNTHTHMRMCCTSWHIKLYDCFTHAHIFIHI